MDDGLRSLHYEAGLSPRHLKVDVAIVGGGIIGLSIGWQLAANGFATAILDRAEPHAASLAASGMLAAAAELEPCSSALFRLAAESQRLWPDFRAGLEAAAETSIDYRDHGTLVVAIGREEVDRLRFRFNLQQSEGAITHWLDAAAVRRLEAGLRPSVAAGIHCPLDHQVEPRRVLTALRRAFVRAGGQLFENSPVSAIELAGGRVSGLHLPSGFVEAPIVVVAAGSWSNVDHLLPPGFELPLRPLKGQSLSLQVSSRFADVNHVIWTDQIHIAPKADRIVVGATVEEAGFDGSSTAGGVYALLEATRRILPSFEELSIESLQVGFRPTSADDAPILGETDVPGLVLATGHHRNGYLLAPVTAAAIATLIRTGDMPDAATPFSLARFDLARHHPPKSETSDADHAQR